MQEHLPSHLAEEPEHHLGITPAACLCQEQGGSQLQTQRETPAKATAPSGQRPCPLPHRVPSPGCPPCSPGSSGMFTSWAGCRSGEALDCERPGDDSSAGALKGLLTGLQTPKLSSGQRKTSMGP